MLIHYPIIFLTFIHFPLFTFHQSIFLSLYKWIYLFMLKSFRMPLHLQQLLYHLELALIYHQIVLQCHRWVIQVSVLILHPLAILWWYLKLSFSIRLNHFRMSLPLQQLLYHLELVLIYHQIVLRCHRWVIQVAVLILHPPAILWWYLNLSISISKNHFRMSSLLPQLLYHLELVLIYHRIVLRCHRWVIQVSVQILLPLVILWWYLNLSISISINYFRIPLPFQQLLYHLE